MACEWCPILKLEISRRDNELERINNEQINFFMSTRDLRMLENFLSSIGTRLDLILGDKSSAPSSLNSPSRSRQEFLGR